MNNSNSDILSQGVFSEEHRDTLHVFWSLLHSCNYQCSYCFQPRVRENCVIIKERIMPMAYRILEYPRPYYAITLSGGEPTLHPFLPDIVRYFLTSRRKVGLTIETNGSHDVAFFTDLTRRIPEYSLQYAISVHPEFADLEHILTLTASVAEQKQLAHVKVMHDPERQSDVERFHRALTGLRAVVAFTSEILPLMRPDNMSLMDVRYTEEHTTWRQQANEHFVRAVTSGPTSYPSFPKAHPVFNLRKKDNTHTVGLDELKPNTRFKDFYCCSGSNLLRIDPDGRFYGATCNMMRNSLPLWRVKDGAVATLSDIVRCRKEHCPSGLNQILPKFRREEDATAWMEARKDREPAIAWEASPLVNPSDPEPRLEDVVRSRLKNMPLLRETVSRIDPATTAVITFGDVLDEAARHYSSLEPPLSRMPDFVLVDWDGGPHEAWEVMAEEHGVRIVPIHERDTLGKTFCLYARPKSKYWEKGCLLPLIRACATSGLEQNYQIDASVTAPMWKLRSNLDFVQKRFADICTVYSALADDESRTVFLAAMKTIATGDPGYLPLSSYPQYQHPQVLPEAGDVLLEGGLAGGETTKRFSQRIGEHGRVIGFEPLKTAHEQSRRATKDCSNVLIEHLGLWSSANTFYIEDRGGGSRMVSVPNERTEECHSIAIDSYLEEKREVCSLIKLDIEGAEMECLKGAVRTIGRFMPKLHVSLYHHRDHYLDIPLWLLEHFPKYKLYMGHHNFWINETCLYALPAVRPVKRFVPPAVPVPLVSVIVPTYNNEDTLRRCIGSILLQSLRDMEIIIVDDASTDRTPEIIVEYVRRYPQIVRTLRFPENMGPGAARNAGLDLALGHYVAFVDSDDMLADHFLRRGVDVMEAEQADIVAFDLTEVRLDNREYLYSVEPGSCAGREALDRMLRQKTGHYAPYARLYRRELLMQYRVRFAEQHRYESLLFGMNAFFMARKTVALSEVGYHKYIRKGSQTFSNLGDREFIDFARSVSALTDFYTLHGLESENEAHACCVRNIYRRHREKIFDAVSRAEKEDRLMDLLTEERLLEVGSSREALCRILEDYAILHCHRKGLKPTVAPEDLDWRAAAAAPPPPKTYRAWADADTPSGPAPVLSVIMPNYNKALYLKDCLHSVLSQSMQDFELIIVDDASTDGSYELLQSYAAMYPCIRLYRMDHNCMQGICRNIGVELARGTYLVFMDSDDRVELDFFARACQDMAEDPVADMLVYGIRNVDIDNNELSVRECNSFCAGGQHALYLYNTNTMPWGPVAKIFRMDFVRNNRLHFAEGVYHEDVQFLMDVMLHSSRIKGMQGEPVYNIINTPESSIRRSTYSYMQVYSACSKLEKRKAFEETYRGMEWTVRDRLLPPLAAYLKVRGEIPLAQKDWGQLARNYPFLQALLIGYAHCRTQASIPQGLLPVFPQPVTRSYTFPVQDVPLVSVIIPTYNQEACIARCLDSVLGQSLRNIEVIVVNDASTDMTLALCEAYARKDPRVVVYSNEKNMGQGYSRNLALEHARGKYITYVDSDDCVTKDFLIIGTSILEFNDGINVAYFAYKRIDSDGVLVYEKRGEERIYDSEELIALRLERTFPGEGVCAAIYRYDFLAMHGVKFPDHLYEDVCFNFTVAKYANKIIFINFVGYIANNVKHEASAVNPKTSTPRHLYGNIKLYRFMELFSEKNRISQDRLCEYIRRREQWANQLYLPYIAKFKSCDVSPFSDELVDDIIEAKSYLRYIIYEYAKLYSQDVGYEAVLDPKDFDLSNENFRHIEHLLSVSENDNCVDDTIFSIIIPVFNAKKKLAKCLDSILIEKEVCFEIILVDDSSTDVETVQICNAYALKDKRIRLYKTPFNCKQGQARNLALKKCRGSYIIFSDADDYFEPGFISSVLRVVQLDDGCDFYDFSWKDVDTKNGKTIRHVLSDGVFYGTDANLCYFRYPLYAMWSKVYRKKFILDNDIKCSPTVINNDVAFLFKLYLKAKKIGLSSYLMYNYMRSHDEESTMRPRVYGKDQFASFLYNLRFTHDLLRSEAVSEDSDLYKRYFKTMSNHVQRKNMLFYIYSCNELKAPSPLTDEVMDTLTLSKEFLRYLFVDYAVLSQKIK